MSRRHLVIVAVVGLFSSAEAGTVVHVDDDAALGGDGSSWGTAYRFLQDALANAVAGDEIRVAQGTYKPDEDEGGSVTPGDRQATLQLINSVSLLGGFAGIGEPDPDDRDLELYVTTISGDLLGDDGPDFANNDENSYHVVTGSGTDETAVLDGYTVTAGNADGGAGNDRGAGMLVETGSPVVANSTFRTNDTTGALGAGLFIGLAAPTFTQCLFEANDNDGVTTWRSNATFLDCAFVENTFGMRNISSDPAVIQCTFSDNIVGMGNDDGSNPTVRDCLLDGNLRTGMENVGSNPVVVDCVFSQNGQDGMWNVISNPIVTGCTFSGNTGRGMMSEEHCNPIVVDCMFSGNQGRGMETSGMFGPADPLVINSVFDGNSTPSIGGAGMFNWGSDAVVVNCLFMGNNATGTGAVGGGMKNFIRDPLVVGCLFVGNSSSFRGGGMANDFSQPIVVNCTFAGNTAGFAGGGVSTRSASNFTAEPSLINCILWDNGLDQITDDAASATTIRYSDIQGGWFGAGDHNIDADPMFVDPANGDFRLSPGSPCIDVGHNNAIADLTDADLGGNPRFADDPDTEDGGCGAPVVVDMGAHEFQGDPATVLFGDMNGDGTVGVADLIAIIQCMGSDEPDCCVADLDLDGEVGTSDVMLLIPKLIHSVSLGLRRGRAGVVALTPGPLCAPMDPRPERDERSLPGRAGTRRPWPEPTPF